ncbi:MAG: alkaline phosphatase [Myxococcota bacterium]
MSDRASRADSERQEPTLAEMTEFSLHRLAKNPKGFVLMVEAAQIDWAGHANDAGWMLNEMMKADEVLRTIRRWMAGRDDTLLLVTGDHETGGFGFTYRSGPSARYDFGEPPMLDLLAAQTRSADALATEFTSAERTPERLYELVRSMTPLTFELDDARRIVAAASGPNGKVAGRRVRDEVMRQLADQVNVVWATQGHTSTPIEVIALGPGAAEFRGVLSHIEVGRRLQRLLF